MAQGYDFIDIYDNIYDTLVTSLSGFGAQSPLLNTDSEADIAQNRVRLSDNRESKTLETLESNAFDWP